MQRIYNLDKWTELRGEHGLHFVNTRPRRVAIEVNAPQRSALSIIDHTGEVHFLALVEGRDTVEFNSLGEFSLISDTDGVMIYTADGADISYEAVAPVIFTKIMERRARNPELDHLSRVMRHNMEAQLARLAQSFERRIAEVAQVAAPQPLTEGDGARPPAAEQPGDAPASGETPAGPDGPSGAASAPVGAAS